MSWTWRARRGWSRSADTPRSDRWLPGALAAALALGGCGAGLACGLGTEEADGLCVPEAGPVVDEDSAGPGDTAPDDTGGDSTSETGETAAPERPAQVYLLAGQSNMAGISQVTGLPDRMRVAQDDVWIYWSGAPDWRGLQPSSPYTSSWASYMGPEVAFGRYLADALPDEQIHLIKHAVGGTALADYWEPGDTPADPQGDGYRDFIQTVERGLGALDDQGIAWQIAGMIWMQGESDATYEPWADAYARNLERFIARVREDVDAPDMPFSLGLIECAGLCAWNDDVRAAQVAVADGDGAVYAFETADLPDYPTDGWHYAGTGMRIMGERFAQSLLGEPLSEFPTPAVRLTGGGTADYYGDYTVGWSFSIDAPILVTDLGVFDLWDDGLAHTTEVAIWDADTGSLIASETVTEGSLQDTPWLDGFRFVGAEPFVLEPGEYVIGNQSFSSDFDYYIHDAGYAAAPGVTWNEGRHVAGTQLYFPDSVYAGTAAVGHWFGPNLLYQPI